MKYILKESSIKKLIDKYSPNIESNVEQISYFGDIPISIRGYLHRHYVNISMNKNGPWYLFNVNGELILCEFKDNNRVNAFSDKGEDVYPSETEILRKLGLNKLGFSLKDIVNILFN